MANGEPASKAFTKANPHVPMTSARYDPANPGQEIND
jgi:hypothetical protein